ncbi:MAG: DUF2520 domain-containing protein [Polyangiaceae bacterium]
MSRAHYAILGAGKVGVALHRAIRAAKMPCKLVPARQVNEHTTWRASLLILAVRDPEVTTWAQRLAAWGTVPSSTAVVHLSGVLPSSVLEPLRAGVGVAQMHPLLSFAAIDAPPSFEGAHMHLEGDVEAVRRARKLASLLGMKPRVMTHVDPAGYHAAAAMLANGSAAVASAAIEVLVNAGVERSLAPKMLAPLLRSVASNLEVLGMPTALTGPVRRGSVSTVERHLEVVGQAGDGVAALYKALVLAQIPIARAIGETSNESLTEIEQRIAR